MAGDGIRGDTSFREILHRLPSEIQVSIYDNVVDEDKTLAISSKSREQTAASTAATKGTDFCINSLHPMMQSNITRANYLRAARRYLIRNCSVINAKVLDCKFGNLIKFIQALEIAETLRSLSMSPEKDFAEPQRSIQVSHKVSSNLDSQPTTLSTWCRKTDQYAKKGYMLNIRHQIARVEDKLTFDSLHRAHSQVLDMDSKHQIDHVMLAFRTYPIGKGMQIGTLEERTAEDERQHGIMRVTHMPPAE